MGGKWTKEYRAEYMKKWREENKEQIKANRRYYYQHHKEKILEQNNPSGIAYRNLHREEINTKAKEWYYSHKNDPEFKKKAYANTKRWIENNRDKWNAYYREYKRKRKALEGQK